MKKSKRDKMTKFIIYFVVLIFIAGILPMFFSIL